MIHLIFATNNDHKTEEVRSALGSAFTLETMRQAGLDIDIPEPHPTLLENALEKARTVARLTGRSAFGEDTGLEVTALQGAPGVLSARYAGEARSAEANMRKVLLGLEGAADRSACFRTVMALVLEGNEFHFEGTCFGHIVDGPRGAQGFGYDPIFVPDGSTLSFAEMDLEQKNRFSHRKRALDQLISFLKNTSCPG